jgi:hypothetical protein
MCSVSASASVAIHRSSWIRIDFNRLDQHPIQNTRSAYIFYSSKVLMLVCDS